MLTSAVSRTSSTWILSSSSSSSCSHLLLHLPDNLLHVDRVGEEGSQEHLRGTNTLLRLLLGSLGEQTAAEAVEGVCGVEMVVHVRKQRRRASMVNASPHTHIT